MSRPGHHMSREDMRKRDERIIQLLGYGLKPIQIAERMGISPRTVTDAKYRHAVKPSLNAIELRAKEYAQRIQKQEQQLDYLRRKRGKVATSVGKVSAET